MKTSILFITLIGIALLPSSSSAKIEIPACIQKMIDSSHATPLFSLFTRIDSYLYRDKMTYLMTSSCCDRFNPLYDRECKQICAPSGGFIGSGDGKCTDFGETATKVANVWIAPRG